MGEAWRALARLRPPGTGGLPRTGARRGPPPYTARRTCSCSRPASAAGLRPGASRGDARRAADGEHGAGHTEVMSMCMARRGWWSPRGCQAWKRHILLRDRRYAGGWGRATTGGGPQRRADARRHPRRVRGGSGRRVRRMARLPPPHATNPAVFSLPCRLGLAGCYHSRRSFAPGSRRRELRHERTGAICESHRSELALASSSFRSISTSIPAACSSRTSWPFCAPWPA